MTTGVERQRLRETAKAAYLRRVLYAETPNIPQKPRKIARENIRAGNLIKYRRLSKADFVQPDRGFYRKTYRRCVQKTES